MIQFPDLIFVLIKSSHILNNLTLKILLTVTIHLTDFLTHLIFIQDLTSCQIFFSINPNSPHHISLILYFNLIDSKFVSLSQFAKYC